MENDNYCATDEKKIYKIIFVDHLRRIIDQILPANIAFSDSVTALNSALHYNTEINWYLPSIRSLNIIILGLKKYYLSSYKIFFLVSI